MIAVGQKAEYITWLTRLITDRATDGESMLSIMGKRTYNFSQGETAFPQDCKTIDYYEAD